MEQELAVRPEKKKKNHTRLWVVLGVLAGLIVGLVLQEIRFSGKISPLQAESIQQVHQIVKEYAIEDYSEAEIIDMMLSGVAQGLRDHYSAYYNKETLQAYQDSKEGIIHGGIGVSVAQKENESVQILEVYEGSPAAEAGLKEGDYFLKVEDEDVSAMSTSDLADRISGEVDTIVRLTVLREGRELVFNVRRAVFQTPMVKSRPIGEFYYIQLKSFNGNAVSMFREAVEKAETMQAKGIILDLRDNYGGDLTVLSEIADLLLPEGEIIYAMDRQGNRVLSRQSGESHTELPLAVLTNCNTASASEALSGAIRDFERGVLVGTKTFGKGIMQTTYPLPNSGAFKLTTARYYLPGGECIHGDGITPQYVVQLPGGVESRPYDMTDEEDTQLQKAMELLSD